MQDHPLTQFRKSRDPQLSQEALADLLGVTKATISRWEAGERFPDRYLWPKIKENTGIGADEMAEWKPASSPSESAA